MKNKKAQAQNYFAVIILLFIFGFCSILAYLIWSSIVTALAAAGIGASNEMIQTTIHNFTLGFAAFDYVIILLFCIMVVGTAALSYKIPTTNGAFIVTIIFGLFWGFVSYFFNYIFIQLVSAPVFTITLGVFPRTMMLCTNLHWVMLILIVVGSITLYGKKSQPEQQVYQ